MVYLFRTKDFIAGVYVLGMFCIETFGRGRVFVTRAEFCKYYGLALATIQYTRNLKYFS